MDINDLNMTIRKLQMWEATLIRKYADRFKANKESLTENPIWQKVRSQKIKNRRIFKIEELQEEQEQENTKM